MNLTLMLADGQLEELAQRVAAILAAREPVLAAPELLTLVEAADIAKVQPRTIANWISRGRLTRYGVPRHPMISRAELEALMSPALPIGNTPRRAAAGPRRREADGFFSGLAQKEGLR